MPRSTHGITTLTPAKLVGCRLEVRWTAVVAAARDRLGVCDSHGRGHARVGFVISVEPVDENHALLEAWLETPKGSRSVLRRQPARYEFACANLLVHFDAVLDGRRVVALSMAAKSVCPDGHGSPAWSDETWRGAGGPQRDGVLYAWSPLPGEIGLGPGAYDPPQARLLPARQDAATA